MKTTQLHYFAWGNFNAFLKEPHEYKSDHEYFDIVDSWIYCWVGATLIATDGGSERVSHPFVSCHTRDADLILEW